MADDVLLTVRDVRQWRRERDELRAEMDALQAKLNAAESRIKFVEDLLGPARLAELFPEHAAEAADSLSASDWVRRTLRSAEKPMSARELVKAAYDSPMQDRVQRNTNTIYNTISRLVDRGDITRLGAYVIDPGVLSHLLATGKNPLDLVRDEQESPEGAPAIVQEILAQHPDGLPSRSLMAVMREHPSLSRQLARNPQYGYTVLSRMVKRGQAVREGGLYLHPSSAPHTEGTNDVDHASEGHPGGATESLQGSSTQAGD